MGAHGFKARSTSDFLPPWINLHDSANANTGGDRHTDSTGTATGRPFNVRSAAGLDHTGMRKDTAITGSAFVNLDLFRVLCQLRLHFAKLNLGYNRRVRALDRLTGICHHARVKAIAQDCPNAAPAPCLTAPGHHTGSRQRVCNLRQ